MAGLKPHDHIHLGLSPKEKPEIDDTLSNILLYVLARL